MPGPLSPLDLVHLFVGHQMPTHVLDVNFYSNIAWFRPHLLAWALAWGNFASNILNVAGRQLASGLAITSNQSSDGVRSLDHPG
jgi:hypothetical protein